MATALERDFDDLARASVAGDVARAAPHLEAILGVTFPLPERVPSVVPTRAPMLVYDVPRHIDVLALRGGARRIAKFEDLPASRANALVRILAAEGLKLVRTGPYSKRVDVSVATPMKTGALYSVIASRGAEAYELAEVEADRSAAGTRRAGELLGYPPCCISHFVAVQASPVAARQGINEAAIRSFVTAAPMPWELNPLSLLAPNAFTPCSAACPHALAFARRVLGAVAQLEPENIGLVRATLMRPVLFFRHSAFFVLDTDSTNPPLAVRRAFLNGVAGELDTLAAWVHHVVGGGLDESMLSMDVNHLLIRGRTRDATLKIIDADVPRLLRFS